MKASALREKATDNCSKSKREFLGEGEKAGVTIREFLQAIRPKGLVTVGGGSGFSGVGKPESGSEVNWMQPRLKNDMKSFKVKYFR